MLLRAPFVPHRAIGVMYNCQIIGVAIEEENIPCGDFPAVPLLPRSVPAVPLLPRSLPAVPLLPRSLPAVPLLCRSRPGPARAPSGEKPRPRGDRSSCCPDLAGERAATEGAGWRAELLLSGPGWRPELLLPGPGWRPELLLSGPGW